MVGRQRLNGGLSERQFLFQHLNDNGGVAGGSHGPVIDRIGQLFNGRQIVLQAGGGSPRYLIEWALVGSLRFSRDHAFSGKCKRVLRSHNTPFYFQSRESVTWFRSMIDTD